jgi:hypothetical protein
MDEERARQILRDLKIRQMDKRPQAFYECIEIVTQYIQRKKLKNFSPSQRGAIERLVDAWNKLKAKDAEESKIHCQKSKKPKRMIQI